MEADNNETYSDPESGQAARLLERLETLRSELGIVGEDLITLLRSAGVAPLVEPGPVSKKQAGNG